MDLLQLEDIVKKCAAQLGIKTLEKKEIIIELVSEDAFCFLIRSEEGKEYRVFAERFADTELELDIKEITKKLDSCDSVKDLLK